MFYIMTKEELTKVADQVTANVLYLSKELLTSDEAALYLGVSKSWLYKLTMRRLIPHFKPMGKLCYFKRAELDEWIQRNHICTAEEIAQKAQGYCMGKKK